MTAYVILAGLGIMFLVPGAYCVLRGMVFEKDPVLAQAGRGFMFFSELFLFLGDVTINNFPWVIISGLLTVYWGWQWWKNRKKGKWLNAAKYYGDKSKAKIKEMVDNMSPSPTPTPIG